MQSNDGKPLWEELLMRHGLIRGLSSFVVAVGFALGAASSAQATDQQPLMCMDICPGNPDAACKAVMGSGSWAGFCAEGSPFGDPCTAPTPVKIVCAPY